MKQKRLSIGCRDWQSMTEKIGAAAAAVYLYLRTMMRGMQAAEITITLSELAQAVKLPSDAAESALRAICAEYMDRADNMDGTITLRDRKEAAAQADMFRKRAARLLSR
jgi:lactam utilization protein B